MKEIKLFGGRGLLLDRTLIMGILNVNDDSFYKESRVSLAGLAALRAVRMADEGADILDIGAESSRPGAPGMSAKDELDALIPAIKAVRRELPRMPISADTRKSFVARMALESGADIVNDVSGLDLPEESGSMIRLISETGAPYILMHTKGTPDIMQQSPSYDDFLSELRTFFVKKISLLTAAGVNRNRIIIDPGVGFGKRACDNLDILSHLPSLKEFGLPLLIGASRKGFIGRFPDSEKIAPPQDRLEGTLAVTAICAYEGVDIVRVHDVLQNAAVSMLAGAVCKRRSV